MPSTTGIILAVQETRFRLLTERGRGLLFLLGHGAGIEPQDLPRLAHRRVRVRYTPCDPRRLLAGVAEDVRPLEDPRTRETRP